MKLALGILGVWVVGLAAVSYVGGLWPAPLRPPSKPFSDAPWAAALSHVSATGKVDLPALRQDPAFAEYIEQLAGKAPDADPNQTVTYWLNAYNALALSAELEGFSPLHTWPINGRRLSLAALERQRLKGDPRFHFALYRGGLHGSTLDGSPFQPEFLDAQLNEAVRRFIAEPTHVRIEGHVVLLSPLFEKYRDEIFAALPEGRGELLQFVWAFMPQSCETRPGCDTRSDLDRACGRTFSQCSIHFLQE